jgi:hypothetical protein
MDQIFVQLVQELKEIFPETTSPKKFIEAVEKITADIHTFEVKNVIMKFSHVTIERGDPPIIQFHVTLEK